MATNWNDPSHPQVQQLAQSTPDQVSPDAAQAAVQALHDQVPPDQLRPVLDQYYASLPPDQLQTIIAQLQQELAQKQNPETQQLVQQVDPNNPTPQQAAELHAHAHEFHPDTVQKVLIAGAGTAAVAGLAVLAARHFSGNH
jgi:hypothetical protein